MLRDDSEGQLLDGIAFNIDTAQWPDVSVRHVRVVYRLDVNEFRGERNLQLIIDYIEALDQES